MEEEVMEEDVPDVDVTDVLLVMDVVKDKEAVTVVPPTPMYSLNRTEAAVLTEYAGIMIIM